MVDTDSDGVVWCDWINVVSILTYGSRGACDPYLLQTRIRRALLGDTPHILRAWRRSRPWGWRRTCPIVGAVRPPAPAAGPTAVPIQEIEVVLKRPVRVKQSPVPVRRRRHRPQVLIVKRNNVGVDLLVRPQRRPGVVHRPLHEVLVVHFSIREVRSRLVGRVAIRRPPRLGDHHPEGAVVQFPHCGHERVDLRVVEVIVYQTVVGIRNRRGRVEECVP